MSEIENEQASYGEQSIKILKGLDAVRKRPGMYIGDTDDGSGLHHMVYEVVDNAIDEALAGWATKVEVILNADGSCTVTDDGRGIPTDIHEGEGVSAAEVIMTQLHAGGKFDQNSYKVSGGLHGVGVSVVNALSDWLVLRIYRLGEAHQMRFERGDTVQALAVNGVAPRRDNGEFLTGTEVTFLPSLSSFAHIDFDRKTIEHRLRELAFLNSGVVIYFRDRREAEPFEEILHYEGGVEAYVRYLDKAKTPLLKTPLVIRGRREKVEIDLSLWWNDGYHETMLCFTNNIPQRDGGTHLSAFRAALTRVITGYAESSGAAREEKIGVTGEDAREGLTCVLSVKVPDPKFSSQTKDKLVSSEVRPAVEGLVSDGIVTLITALGAGSGRDAFDIEKIRYHRIVVMTDADVDGAHIRTLLLTFFYRQMPQVLERGYLYIAQPPLYKATKGKSSRYLKNDAEMEAFLFDEGVSDAVLELSSGVQMAGADLLELVQNAKAAQANVERLAARAPTFAVEQAALAGLLGDAPDPLAVARRLDLYAEEGDGLWTGEAGEAGAFVFSRARRGVTERVVLDGLLLHSADARRLAERAKELAELFVGEATYRRRDKSARIRGPLDLVEAVFDAGRRGLSIQRYKGLGEMNPEQLWETTLDSRARTLLQVKVTHADNADDMFPRL